MALFSASLNSSESAPLICFGLFKFCFSCKHNYFYWVFRNFKGFFVAIEFVSNLVNIINIYGPLLGSFCTVCSLHCSVVCRLDLFHFGVFPWCIHFLVHSVVVKLVVSKNCLKLVHEYLQNYSKTQYHKNLKISQKVARNIFSDKKPQSFWNWRHQLGEEWNKSVRKDHFLHLSKSSVEFR